MAQQPFFKNVQDAVTAQNRLLTQISTGISRQELALQDDLQRNSFDEFKAKNPNSLLQDVNEYEQFRSNYLEKPNRDRGLKDMGIAYGLEEGFNRGLNLTGVSPAWLGRTDDETRELDFSTAKFNSNAFDGAGGIDVQVRVADKKNNRSFTAPLTFLGRAVGSLFGAGGAEAVEEATIKTVPLDVFYGMYSNIKEDTQVRLGDPGIRDMRKDKQDFFTGGTKSNLTYFSTNPGDRGKRDAFLAELAGFEADFSGQTSPAEKTKTTEPLEPVTYQSNLELGLTDEDYQTLINDRLGFKLSEDKQRALNSYVFTPGTTPFNISPEDFNSDKYSQRDRRNLTQAATIKTNQNISRAIRESLIPLEIFEKPIGKSIREAVGVPSSEKISVADQNKQKELETLYGTNGVLSPSKVLNDAFRINPNLLSEFQADPVAFADKYKNNINALKGTPVSNNEKSDIIKNSPFKLSKDDLAALKEAREEGNLQEYSNIVDRIIQSGDIPNEEQQNKIVSVLQKTNSFIRTSKQLDTSFNTQIMLNMIASLPPDQREKYKEALFTFTETGYLTLAGVEQERKILSDQMTDRRAREKAGPTSMSDVTKNFLGFVERMSDPSFDINREIDIGQEIRALSNQVKTAADMRAFADAAGVYLKTFFDEKGKPSWVDRILSFGQAKGPASASLSLKPDVQVWDAKFNRTNNKDEARYFAPMDPGGKAIRGQAVAINTVLQGPGAPAIPVLLELALQKDKFNMSGEG